MFKGVEQPRKFGEQSLVRVSSSSPRQCSASGKSLPLAVEINASENRLSASLECGEIRRDPPGDTWLSASVVMITPPLSSLSSSHPSAISIAARRARRACAAAGGK